MGAKADAEAEKQRVAQLALEAERDADAAAARAVLEKEKAVTEAKAAIARAEAAAHERLRAEQVKRLADEAAAAAKRAEAYRQAQEGLSVDAKQLRLKFQRNTQSHADMEAAAHNAAMARRRTLNKEHLCAMGTMSKRKRHW